MVDLDTSALERARLLAQQRSRRWLSPNRTVATFDPSGLSGSQVPGSGLCSGRPVAGAGHDESMADHAGDRWPASVRDLLPAERRELAAVNHDDTIIGWPRSWPGCAARWPRDERRQIDRRVSASALLELALQQATQGRSGTREAA